MREIPINCPVCRDPLVNDFVPTSKNNELHYKKCTKRLDHNISYLLDDIGALYSVTITLNVGRILKACWVYDIHKLFVYDHIQRMELPYFDPDFSDYKKLTNKIKLYMLLS
jgi:hypothetical protein